MRSGGRGALPNRQDDLAVARAMETNWNSTPAQNGCVGDWLIDERAWRRQLNEKDLNSVLGAVAEWHRRPDRQDGCVGDWHIDERAWRRQLNEKDLSSVLGAVVEKHRRLDRQDGRRNGHWDSHSILEQMGMLFNLACEDSWRCGFTGVRVTIAPGPRRIAFQRVDPTCGHTPDNLRLVCKAAARLPRRVAVDHLYFLRVFLVQTVVPVSDEVKDAAQKVLEDM